MRRAKAGDAIWEPEGTYLLMRAEATCRCDTPVSCVVHLVIDPLKIPACIYSSNITNIFITGRGKVTERYIVYI